MTTRVDAKRGKSRQYKENSVAREMQMLYRADAAISNTTPRMRRASLEFLWDKWIAHEQEQK